MGQEPTMLAVGVGGDGGSFGHFVLSYHLFSFSLSLGDSSIQTEIQSHRAINLKQPTNQLFMDGFCHPGSKQKLTKVVSLCKNGAKISRHTNTP